MASEAPPPPPVNAWEHRALDYQFPGPATSAAQDVAAPSAWCRLEDPLIFPGLYSASGFDLMSILLRIISRPNPQIELGAVDCSVALVVCDLELPDSPIVYASDSFCDMTGYSRSEVIGHNCRFLQSPANGRPGSPSQATKAAAAQIRHAMDTRNEVQVQLLNYKKNGEPFKNLLSIIPIEMDAAGYHYAVGFQVQAD